MGASRAKTKGTNKRKAPVDSEKDVDVVSQRRRMIEEAAHETNDGVERSMKGVSLQDTCDLIAELSEGILENPESAFQSQTGVDGEKLVSPMRQLLGIAATQDNAQHQYTAHMAMMSLLAVFTDIMPSYRIRLPTEQEMAVKVSKDTKKLWDYEKSLLQHYQQYLKLLEGTWNRNSTSGPDGKPTRSATTAMLSMAELLKKAFAFNFGSQLLTAVVRCTAVNSAVGDACCEAIKHVFTNDAQGQIAMEAARLLSKMIQKRNFRVRPEVLRTFLALPLRVHADEVEAAKLASKVKAKKRKKDKELAAIEEEMKEGEARVDKLILARAQADTLQAVTLTYFRILKSTDVPDEVLPPTLEGLAKFAHLINIDTVMDILAVLRELLKRDLPMDASLNCILTAFATLQGPGKELKIDQKEYIVPLYQQIPRLIEESNTSDSKHNYTDLVIQCVTAAFIKRREFSVVRLAAFVKQLMTTALHTPAPKAVPLLSLVRQILQRYPSVQQLLENEQDVLTVGEYTPDATDPELANPNATSGWELATLRFHWHPKIRQQGEAASTLQMLQFPAESPDRLREGLVQDRDELYIPFQRFSKRHPLEQSKDKKGKPRFLKARYKKCDEIPSVIPF
eukprot:scaffold3337_cov169-Amphora_coffeaeformis.AAC.32